jgi:hypothetical protein
LRGEAEVAAERAQLRIAEAHEQMAVARKLAAEATQAAQAAAEQAQRQAQSIAQKAEEDAGTAARVLDEARGTEQSLAGEVARAVRAEQQYEVPQRLSDHTRAELIAIAEPLAIHGAARMRKDQLVRSIQRASRTKAAAHN